MMNFPFQHKKNSRVTSSIGGKDENLKGEQYKMIKIL